MKITITQLPGALSDSDGNLVVPAVGEEVEVDKAVGESLVNEGFAEKPKRGSSARDRKPSEDTQDKAAQTAETR